MSNQSSFDYRHLLNNQWLIEILSFGLLSYGRRKMLRAIQPHSTSILDLMCGPIPIFSRIQLNQNQTSSYTGVDIIERLNRNYNRKRLDKQITFLRHDLNKLLVLPNKKSVIICSYGLKIALAEFSDQFVKTIALNASDNCTISFVEFCLPANKLKRILVLTYLNFLRNLAYLLRSKLAIAIKELIKFLKEKEAYLTMIKKLEEEGFECEVEDGFLGILLYVRGKRCLV